MNEKQHILKILRSRPGAAWSLEEIFQQMKKEGVIFDKPLISKTLQVLRQEKLIYSWARKWRANLGDWRFSK